MLQLAVERRCVTELKAEVDILLRQLAETRAALDDRNMMIRLVAAPCSATLH